jgi:cytochrome P450
MSFADSISLEDLERDPFPILERLRRESPVVFVPSLGMWFVTRWDDVVAVCEQPNRFRSNTEPSWLRSVLGENMLTLDGQAHNRIADGMRAPFAGGGAGGVLQRVLPEKFNELLNDVVASSRDSTSGNSIDLMTAYAEPLANISLQLALGFDQISWQQLAAWCRGVCTGIANFENDPTKADIGNQAKAELAAALDSQLAQIDSQLANNESVHGGLAHFVQAGFQRDEIVNNVRLMISGGINEPRDGVGLVMHVLLTMPEVMSAVRADRSILRRVIEETFQFHSPVGTATRQTVGEQTIDGVTIPSGDLVAGVLSAANRDPQRWTDPDTFRFERNEGAHLAFATGEHRCLGEWIGRQQVRIGVECLLDRFSRIELVEEPELRGFEFRGPTSLQIAFE